MADRPRRRRISVTAAREFRAALSRADGDAKQRMATQKRDGQSGDRLSGYMCGAFDVLGDLIDWIDREDPDPDD